MPQIKKVPNGLGSRVRAALSRWWAVPDRRKQGQRLGFGVALVTAALSALALYRGQESRMEELSMVSAALLATALVYPDALYPVAWLLEEAFKLVTRALLYVMLVLIFYLVFAPVGIVVRLLGKDPLMQKLEPEADSYWIERKPRDRSRVEKQF